MDDFDSRPEVEYRINEIKNRSMKNFQTEALKLKGGGRIKITTEYHDHVRHSENIYNWSLRRTRER